MLKYLNSISLIIIAIGVIVISSCLLSQSPPPPSQWEYKCLEIMSVPENFESWNSWNKEGWEPVMKMDGERQYLMRRPKH